VARDRKRAKQRRDRERRSGAKGASERAKQRLLSDESTLNAAAPLEHGSGEADLAAARVAVESGALGRETEEPAGPRADENGEATHPIAAAGDEEELQAGPPARHPQPDGNRVAAFVRGSWTELQRVQWPDRRQVAQATGVVLGFVIIAGGFLGLADLLASKLVDLII